MCARACLCVHVHVCVCVRLCLCVCVCMRYLFLWHRCHLASKYRGHIVGKQMPLVTGAGAKPWTMTSDASLTNPNPTVHSTPASKLHSISGPHVRSQSDLFLFNFPPRVKKHLRMETDGQHLHFGQRSKWVKNYNSTEDFLQSDICWIQKQVIKKVIGDSV